MESAFSDSVYHIYHSSLKIIANSCTSLLAKGFIFISVEEEEKAKETEWVAVVAGQQARRGLKKIKYLPARLGSAPVSSVSLAVVGHCKPS
jgi:hypothetical protein